MSHPPRRFDSTQWSLVLAAGQRSSPEADAALTQLCQRYWLPIYAFVRRRIDDTHRAEDLTQDFLCRMNERNLWAVADPQRGKFRTFLLTSLQNFLATQHRKEIAQKRGGDRAGFSLDFGEAELRLSSVISDQRTPETEFDRQWALMLLDTVLRRVQEEMAAAGKVRQFEVLKSFLAGRGKDRSFADAAKQLDISEGAAKTAAHRLRRRYRQLLRAEIAQTVASPQEVDDEIANLFAALGRYRIDSSQRITESSSPS